MSSLNPNQRRNAEFIYQRALSRGLSPQRAQELASAAYAESGLDPHAKNAKSGAAGYYQLLSSGYVNEANKHGGVYDPAANFDAIEPDYARYWSQHPNAAPGEAAAAVERSGEGAGFYSGGMDMLGFLSGKGGGGSAGVSPVVQLGNGLAPQAASGPDPRRAFALAMAAQIGHKRDPGALLSALETLRGGLAGQQQPSDPASVAYTQPQTPPQYGAYHGGKVRFEGNTSGEDPAFLDALSQAVLAAGGDAVRITSGYRDPAHNKAVGGVKGSLHTQGRADDGYAHINGQWVPLGTALRAIAGKYGLRSGDVPGFFNGKPDPVHVDYGYGH